MKGIILAGGTGSRLYPLTNVVSKQLLPIYDKPMVYYPLSALMLAGIQDILLISTPTDLPQYQRLLGDGTDFGIRISYAEQPRPEGLAQAFIIGRDFVGTDSVALVLGDNIFYGQGFSEILRQAVLRLQSNTATIFGYYVTQPERYGVAEFDSAGKVISIEEKPLHPKSNYAIVGLYFYPNSVLDIADSIRPSARGELEITSVNQAYVDRGQLWLEKLGRGFSWLDTGTHDSLLDAANFVSVIQARQGLKIACLEEIAYAQGWLAREQLSQIAESMRNNQYGQYLFQILEG